MQKKKKRKYRASALVVSLLVLAAILVTAMSVSLVSIKERSISSNASKSSQAFQNADSGEEIALEKIKNGWTSINDFTNGGMTCNNGVITDNLTRGKYKLTFKDSSDTPITTCNSTDTIASIKSVGEYGESQRAIEVAVAAGGDAISTGLYGNCWGRSDPNGTGQNSCIMAKAPAYCKNTNIGNGNVSRDCACPNGYEMVSTGEYAGINVMNYWYTCYKE